MSEERIQVTFYENHGWERGYFDYEQDGFGPVCDTLEQTVDTLIALMEDPHMPDEYRMRAEGFFFEPPEGTSRCQLVVEAIRALDER